MSLENQPQPPGEHGLQGARMTSASVTVGSSLLIGAVMMLTDYLGWVQLPQPATVLVTVVMILAGGVIYEALHGRRPKGLLIAAAILAILAIPATGSETSGWDHDHHWGDHGWSDHGWDESSDDTNATTEGGRS